MRDSLRQFLFSGPAVSVFIFLLLVVFSCIGTKGALLSAEGEPCEFPDECEEGLVCARTGTCEQPGAPGTGVQNDPCESEDDCSIGLLCAGNNTCQPPGIEGLTGDEGHDCYGTAFCMPELVCNFAGKCVEKGGPGTKEAGEKCDAHEDCQFLHFCGPDGKCMEIPNFQGLECESPDDIGGPDRILFEVPRGKVMEFYRLPFPNDIRLKNGKVDLSGHPNPGTIIPNDPISEYFNLIENDLDGFGTNQTVLFRFSQRVQFDGMKIGSQLGDGKTMYLLNIDPDSEDYGTNVPTSFVANTERGNYICYNWFGFGPTSGYPLEPGTTYAAIITKGIKSNSGKALARDDDFAAVIGDAEPSDDTLKQAWNAYKPLRDFLGEQSYSSSDVLAAAVFTTQNVHDPFANVREAVRDQGVPTLNDLMLCDGSSQSPADDGLSGEEHERGCFDVDSAFDELQATVSLPVFQKGTKPYKTSDDGGNFEYHQGMVPKVQGSEDVNVAISIPKVAGMPETGWPVLLYAHGTGGTYRSFITNGIAQTLSDVNDVGFAVISIDGVLHGPRRGESQEDPDTLVYNFLNPKAARDNFLQGAADYFSLVNLVENLDLDEADSPTEEAVSFDTEKIYFMGHSQGSTGGVLFAAYEPMVKAVILSGAGGDLKQSLLNKTNPVDISAAIKMVLADIDVNGAHPLLNLFQMLMERSDPVNFGRSLHREPVVLEEVPIPGKSVLQTFGAGDTYSPPQTMKAQALSISMQIARPSVEAVGGLAVVDTPVTENYSGGEENPRVTAVMIQYNPGDYDGHYVSTRNADCLTQWTEFLASAVTDGIPTLSAP